MLQSIYINKEDDILYITVLPRYKAKLIIPSYNANLAKVSKLIYFPSLIMPNCLITFIKIHN
jgi:hypothetical protein